MSVLTVTLDGRIAVVTLDNPPVNAISAEVRQGLVDMADLFDADEGIDAVVLNCAGRTFIAGADVREFGKPPIEPHLPDVVMRLEQAKKPWIAAIHGSALGGGFEIALGCRFRVAAEGAKIGLPEVNLGIIPGASGTVRTPRLAGVETAVDLAVTGKPLSVADAYKAGLVDAVLTGDLQKAAVEFARQVLTKPLPFRVSERPVEPLEEAYWQTAAKRAEKAGHRAPVAALNSIRFASENRFADAMEFERDTFLALRASDEAAALRAVFFAERAAAKPEFLKGIAPRSVTSVGIVGGGTMGSGIASACLGAGFNVVLIERDEDALRRGQSNIEKTFAGAVKRGKMSDAKKSQLMAKLSLSADYAALAKSDLVVEAVFEDIAVKCEVFEQLDRHCRRDTILATNTSYLDPQRIASVLKDPKRFLGLHFFSPANIMKLLEVVPIPETAPAVLASAFALARKLGKVPVQAGICEGFIGNRILKRYRAEAEALVCSGNSITDIDAAMRMFGFKMGPFQAQDLGGLDIAFLQREGARAAGRNVQETLGDILVRAGRKGQKTSGGWYDYAKGDRTPQPSSAVSELLKTRITRQVPLGRNEISSRLVSAMADEGQAIMDEGIALSATDIDLVEILGYGFPRWKGGPMFWAGRQKAER